MSFVFAMVTISVPQYTICSKACFLFGAGVYLLNSEFGSSLGTVPQGRWLKCSPSPVPSHQGSAVIYCFELLSLELTLALVTVVLINASF